MGKGRQWLCILRSTPQNTKHTFHQTHPIQNGNKPTFMSVARPIVLIYSIYDHENMMAYVRKVESVYAAHRSIWICICICYYLYLYLYMLLFVFVFVCRAQKQGEVATWQSCNKSSVTGNSFIRHCPLHKKLSSYVTYENTPNLFLSTHNYVFEKCSVLWSVIWNSNVSGHFIFLINDDCGKTTSSGIFHRIWT